MSVKSYTQKLKDPKWQKKRLEVMNNQNFECSNCGADDVPLHVHHGMYIPRTNPWDYPDTMLHCLCEECHSSTETVLHKLRIAIGSAAPAVLDYVLSILDGHHNAAELDRAAIRAATFAFCQLMEIDELLLEPVVDYLVVKKRIERRRRRFEESLKLAQDPTDEL